MAVANYVCDVTPLRVFRKDGGAFAEKYARAYAEVSDEETGAHAEIAARILADPLRPGMMATVEVESEWRPVDLDERLTRTHADALRALVASFDRATVPWFGAFLELVADLRHHMAPGGVLVVNDFGS